MAYWETPGTMNNTWGYSKFDNDWKSTEELIFWLVDIASKGGNYLLNVGPKADGTIPDRASRGWPALGRWTKVNGESIYGTRRWLVDREGSTKPAMKGTASARPKASQPGSPPRIFGSPPAGKSIRQRVHEAGRWPRQGEDAGEEQSGFKGIGGEIRSSAGVRRDAELEADGERARGRVAQGIRAGLRLLSRSQPLG